MRSDSPRRPIGVVLGTEAGVAGRITQGLVSGFGGFGSAGNAGCGFGRVRAVRMLAMPEEASRAVSGVSPYLHSINFRTEVWSNVVRTTRGLFGFPRVNG